MSREEMKNIERLEIMEEKLNVSIEGIYAKYAKYDEDSRYITVTGEIHASSGTTIEEDIEIIVTAYNSEGKVIATASDYIYADDFFALSPIEICLDVIEKPTKIRVYPTKCSI